jgi:beta-galactosidase GanA
LYGCTCRFQKWPEDALEAVAYKFLKEMGNNLVRVNRKTV